MTHVRFVRLAALAASRASGGFRHGAVVVRDGKVLASGCNRLCAVVTDSVHAEAAVIKRIPRLKLHGTTMYVVRIGQDDRLLQSKPCKRCSRFLERIGLKRIYYTCAASVDS
jgi:tRNA(Arg) A34 adenosine deaminase TadA